MRRYVLRSVPLAIKDREGWLQRFIGAGPAAPGCFRWRSWAWSPGRSLRPKRCKLLRCGGLQEIATQPSLRIRPAFEGGSILLLFQHGSARFSILKEWSWAKTFAEARLRTSKPGTSLLSMVPLEQTLGTAWPVYDLWVLLRRLRRDVRVLQPVDLDPVLKLLRAAQGGSVPSIAQELQSRVS